MVCGQDKQAIIIIINFIVVGLLAFYLIKNYKKISNTEKILLLMISSGGISNLIDRIYRGYVVDYIDINQMINYPIFNIADISIVLGVIGFIIYVLIKNRRNV